MRDEFLSVAAHELKTPMTSLRLAIDVLGRSLSQDKTPDVQRLKSITDSIDRQTNRLSRLISQLLETVRLQEDRLELNRSHVDLVGLVDEMIQQSRHRPDAPAITVSMPETLDAFVDPLRFEQVLANLLDNAIKFSPDGGVIEVEMSEAVPGRVRLVVQDHGLGVPPDKRDQLFSRFYQAHGSDFRSGMGLGLYISRQIVEHHEGTIVALFPETGGTRMVIEMPIADDSGYADDTASATFGDPPTTVG